MSVITVKGRSGTQSISHNSLRLINTGDSLSCPSASLLVSDGWKQSTVSGMGKKGKNVVGEIYVPAHQAHGIYGPRTDWHPDSCRGACCLFLAKSKLNSAGLGVLDNQLFVYSSGPNVCALICSPNIWPDNEIQCEVVSQHPGNLLYFSWFPHSAHAGVQ